MENIPPSEPQVPAAASPVRKRRWPIALLILLLMTASTAGYLLFDQLSPTHRLDREIEAQLEHIRRDQTRFNYHGNPGALERMKEIVTSFFERFSSQNSSQHGYVGSYEVVEKLGKLDPAASHLLVKKLGTEPMPEVRAVILEALVYFKEPDPTPIMEKALAQDAAGDVRAAAVRAINGLDPVRSTAALLAALRNDTDPEVRREVAGALDSLGVSVALPPLLKTLETDADNGVRGAAARTLGRLGDAQAVPILRTVLPVQNDELHKDVLVALADLKDKEVVPHLIRTLEKQVTKVKQAATNQATGRIYSSHEIDTELVQALGELGDPRGVPVLLAALNTNSDEWILETVTGALGTLRDPQAVPALLAKLTGGGKLAPHAATALGEIGGPEVFKALLAFVSEPTGDRRFHAAQALGKTGHRAVLPVLKEALAKSSDEEIRKHAAEALGLIGDAQAVPELVQALGASEAEIVQEAAWALSHIGDVQGAAPLVGSLKHREFGVRFSAAFALAGIQSPASIPALKEVLADKEERAQLAAACSLAFHGSAEGYETLCRNLKSRENWQRFAAAVGLFRLGTPEALAQLKTRSEDADASVRTFINTGLSRGAPAGLAELLQGGADDFRHYAARMLPLFRDATTIPALLAASTDAKPEVRNAARVAAVQLEKFKPRSKMP